MYKRTWPKTGVEKPIMFDSFEEHSKRNDTLIDQSGTLLKNIIQVLCKLHSSNISGLGLRN